MALVLHTGSDLNNALKRGFHLFSVEVLLPFRFFPHFSEKGANVNIIFSWCPSFAFSHFYKLL